MEEKMDIKDVDLESLTAEELSPDEKGKNKSKKSTAFEWIKTFAIPIIVAILILQVIRPTLVQQQSMMPNIQPNNYLIVYKLAYSFGNSPSFGDIIVFESDLKQEGSDKNKYLIKRVVASEGQTIQITGGKVYIDGEELYEPYLNGIETTGEVMPVEVPEGCVFVMGDNRANSTDSRSSEVGFVSVDRIMGKVVLRLYPFDEIGGVYSGDLSIE